MKILWGENFGFGLKIEKKKKTVGNLHGKTKKKKMQINQPNSPQTYLIFFWLFLLRKKEKLVNYYIKELLFSVTFRKATKLPLPPFTQHHPNLLLKRFNSL